MEGNNNEKLGVEEEIEEFQPFDPEKISIDTKPITMDTVLRRLEQGSIILNPDFQRNEVWTQEKKCRLIESLMLKIPLPMFYVSADENGIFYVVDGLQRLSTLRSFVLGDKFLETKESRYKGAGFKLEKLEFWGDAYNNLMFHELPTNITNRILETQFTFTIINPGTPEEVKRNIFKRINTGGEPLKPQEIRHALYIGESTTVLSKLSIKNSFLKATDNSVKSNRMMDRELILRFLSFVVRDKKEYPQNNDMDSFLSDTMRIMNTMPTLNEIDGSAIFKSNRNPKGIDKDSILIKDLNHLEKIFELAMIRAHKLFGVHAFRKSYGDKRRTPINKALFEVWSVLLSQLSEESFSELLKNKTGLFNEYHQFLENPNSIYLISRDSWKSKSVSSRHDFLSNLIYKHSR